MNFIKEEAIRYVLQLDTLFFVLVWKIVFMTNQEKWMSKYLILQEYVRQRGHFPDKHNKLLNWVKYQRKRIKAGRMSEEQMELFKELCDQRSNEHTGGRRKKILSDMPTLEFAEEQ